MEGSDDGSTWTVLPTDPDTRIGVISWGNSESRTFTLGSPTQSLTLASTAAATAVPMAGSATYTIYRIDVNGNGGGSNWCIEEMTFIKLPDNTRFPLGKQ